MESKSNEKGKQVWQEEAKVGELWLLKMEPIVPVVSQAYAKPSLNLKLVCQPVLPK